MLSSLVQLFRMGDIRVNTDHPLEGEELNYVLVSAFEASQHFAYLNAYTTGLSEKEIKDIVEGLWHIKDREDALEALSNLIKQNQDKNLSTVYKAVSQLDYKSYLKENLPEDKIALEHYIVYCEDLKKVLPLLLKKKVFSSYQEAEAYKDTAWNMARGALMARCAYDMGFFNEMVTKSILIGLYKELKKNCKTWEGYTKSYILGRSLNGHADYKDIQYLSHKLLTHKKSPLRGHVLI